MCYIIDTESSLYLIMKLENERKISTKRFLEIVVSLNTQFKNKNLNYLIDTSLDDLKNFIYTHNYFYLVGNTISFTKNMDYVDKFVKSVLPTKVLESQIMQSA